MQVLKVKTGKEYNILLSRGLVNNCGEYISEISKAKNVLVISDTNVFKFYGDTVLKSLNENGFSCFTHIFEAGEQSKTLSTVHDIYNTLATNNFSRSDLIVALGGGVTGDMSGFVASTFLRGIKFVQIPTSLLAQVDSSVGGKTGVDIKQGKNLIGAFWQPSLVLIDPTTLNTLPDLYFNDGMAEVIKYGCIKDENLFKTLENNDAKTIIDDIIFRCVDIKREVVENDEHEKGERMLLNFGHTLGHALEKVYNFETLTHGQAVSIGMYLICNAFEKNGITQKGSTQRLLNLIKKYNLPFNDDTPINTIIDNCLNDKKSSGDNMNLIVLNKIGDSFVKEMPKKDIYNYFK